MLFSKIKIRHNPDRKGSQPHGIPCGLASKIMDFESRIKDPTAPIAIDFNSGRKVLMFAFGGFANGIGLPMFEFNNLTRGLESINKIYLRDKYGVWYHRGLSDIGGNIDGIASFLQQYTSHPATQRIIVFGNSGGGYAALLFGHILKADEVHAFNPLTFLNPIRRIVLRDVLSWKPTLTLLYAYRAQRKYYDLKKVLSKSPSTPRHFHIYFSANRRSDRLHATRIKSIPGIHLHPYQYGQHNLVRMLKKSGELSQIVDLALRRSASMARDSQPKTRPTPGARAPMP